ncbi:MAG: zonular occludens toxin domain-containing protein [Candidatus Bathyarchaeia archaeon]
MITLITAVPGSGKTLLAVGLIIKYTTEGRHVYHNINGLQVHKFPHPDRIHDAPNDWRDTPHGSVVIYDECQQPHLYPATAQRGAVDDERLTAMETHRHTGHDLIFITQAPTFLHHHARKLVGQHIHLYRGGGSKIVARYEWSHVCDNPNDRREQERADFQAFPFNKAHFDLYQSSTIHTHKFKIPRKLIILGIFILSLVSFLVYLGYDSFLVTGEFHKQPESPPAQVQARAAAVPAIYSWASAEPAIPVAGCIANADRSRCQCFSDDGVTLTLEHAQCLSILNNPLPRSIKVNQSKSKNNS